MSGSSSARAASAAREPPLTAVAGDEPARARRPLDVLEEPPAREAEWPDALLLLGDQVYADEVSPATLEFIEPPRHDRPPGEEVADFEEYTRLYRESWSDPDIRWLLSTVPQR